MNYSVNTTQAIVDPLKKHEVIPDVVPDFEPQGFLTIEYPHSNSVTLGNDISVPMAGSLPEITYTSTSGVSDPDNDRFIVVLTDPDAPSRTDHKWSEYCHYVRTDIQLVPNNKLASAAGAAGGVSREFVCADLNANGNTLVEYMGPAPPKGTGKHRYVFLLYRQNAPSSQLTKIKDRANWGYGEPAVGADKWAKENKLELLAANFFFAENA
ncbi:uncharacterized protein GWK60_B00913 [Nakaseomyces glabratus]|nr:Phosphatidylethanolamine-binding protein [Nakaseomyces glabratus]QNG12351.1 uncharacterized protein GWK60_B00913 [Nakaseomyces glabratus]